MKITKQLFLTLALSASLWTSAQVGIGTKTPAAGSILDISAPDKGILIPRVNLTSTTQDIDGVTGQPESLMIYNNGTTFPKGYYYWDSVQWRTINNTTLQTPTITQLFCETATLAPSIYTAGVAYNGIMEVPYSGGNGGRYDAGSAITSTGVTGLTATLQAGTLALGSGKLVYRITGTPSASSPNGATFALPTTFGATGCNVTVGNGFEPFVLFQNGIASVVNNNTNLTALFNGLDGPYQYLPNSSINVTLPSSFALNNILVRYDIWGDATCNDCAGSLRYALRYRRNGGAWTVVNSIMMSGWSQPRNGIIRWNAPIAYTISNLTAGNYEFQIGITRETEFNIPAGFVPQFWGLIGSAQVYVKN